MHNQNQPYPMVHPITFSQNPLIQHLATDPYWTVSDIKKRPVDAKALLDTGEVKFARFDGESPLVTLPELDNNHNLQAVNRAYRLRARENRVIAIDVEPEAPESMKQDILAFPAHYTELSTNGGVHAIILVPEDCINDENRYMFDDLAVVKETVPIDPVTKKQERGAYFEVLFNDHFITFTKRMVTEKECVNYNQNPEAKARLVRFLDSLVVMDKKRKYDRELAKKFRIDMLEDMMDEETKENIDEFINMKPFDRAKQQANQKQVSDFGDDFSRYEMSVANGLASHVLRIRKLCLDTQSFRDMVEAFTDQDLVYAIYLLLQEAVPYRDKHDEDREGLPWLMFTARRAYEYMKAQNAKQQKNKK